jgi:hypothetical protein
MEQIFWSVKVKYLSEPEPRSVGTESFSHEEVARFLNERFELSEPFPDWKLEQIHSRGNAGSLEMVLKEKETQQLCKITIWNKDKLNLERRNFSK